MDLSTYFGHMDNLKKCHFFHRTPYLRPLDRPWRHLGPACGVNALRYDTASATPARAPLFERRDNCASAAVMAAAMPRSTLRRLALDLRFSGRRRQSGDGDSSTLMLTLIPGASGAATTTPDLPVRRLCSRSLLLFSQGLTGGGIIHGRVAE